MFSFQPFFLFKHNSNEAKNRNNEIEIFDDFTEIESESSKSFGLNLHQILVICVLTH